jgi:lysyl-tRNA synthetase class 2
MRTATLPSVPSKEQLPQQPKLSLAHFRPSRRQEQVARVTVLVYFIASILAVVQSPLGRFSSGPGWVDVLGDVLNLPIADGLFGAVLLLLLTGALLRRKRFAVWVVIGLQIAGAALALLVLVRAASGSRSHFLRGLDMGTGSQIITYAGGFFGVVAALGLMWARPAFPARRSPGSRRAALFTLLIGLAVSITVAVGLAEAFDGSLAHPFTPVWQGVRAALGLTDLTGQPPRMRHLPTWIAWLGST